MSFGNDSSQPQDNYRPGAGRSVVVKTSAFNMGWGRSGSVEPTWPTTLGAHVTDSSGIRWRAILARHTIGTVEGIYGNANFTANDLSAYPNNFFQYGTLTWLTGANAGLAVEVHQFLKVPSPNVELFEEMPFAITPGDTFKIVVGCAKTRSVCKTFLNVHNMRGFPDMPTEDKAMVTPNFSQQGTPNQQDSGGS